MSRRYTELPCGLEIKIEGPYIYLRGDWGAPGYNHSADGEPDWKVSAYGSCYLTFDRAKIAISNSSSNLRALSEFFAKEADRLEKKGF